MSVMADVRKVILLLIFLVLLAIPIATRAQDASIDDLRAQIQALLEQVRALQQQIVQISGGAAVSGTSNVSPPGSVGQPLCPNLRRVLHLGLRGDDGSELQRFLRHTGDFTFPEVTGFFGPATQVAVQRFQCREIGICSGSAEENGYGLVGPRTRAAVLARCGVEQVGQFAPGQLRSQEPGGARTTAPISLTDFAFQGQCKDETTAYLQCRRDASTTSADDCAESKQVMLQCVRAVDNRIAASGEDVVVASGPCADEANAHRQCVQSGNPSACAEGTRQAVLACREALHPLPPPKPSSPQSDSPAPSDGVSRDKLCLTEREAYVQCVRSGDFLSCFSEKREALLSCIVTAIPESQGLCGGEQRAYRQCIVSSNRATCMEETRQALITCKKSQVSTSPVGMLGAAAAKACPHYIFTEPPCLSERIQFKQCVSNNVGNAVASGQGQAVSQPTGPACTAVHQQFEQCVVSFNCKENQAGGE